MLHDLNNRFEYTRDPEQFGLKDFWYIMKNDTGPLKGDCDDYALTALWYLERKSMLRFWWALLTRKAKVWYCIYTPNNEGHAVLQYQDKWIDNIQKQFVSDTLEPLGYDMKYPFNILVILRKMGYFKL